MAVCEESIGHPRDRAERTHFLSSWTERLDFGPKERTYSGSHQHTFSVDTESHSDSQESSSKSNSSAPSSPAEVVYSRTSQHVFTANAEATPDSDVLSVPSAFLELPLEIRRSIYYYAFLPSPEYRQVLRPLRAKYSNSWWGTEEMSRILRVNRQLHYEAEEMLHSAFEFSFLETTPYRIESFLESLSPKARNIIQHASCHITMNERIRDSIRRGYIENWKACFGVMCKEMSGLRKVALQFRFLDSPSTSIMKATFIESVTDLAKAFDGEKEISLHSYDGSSPVDRKGAELVEECGRMIAKPRHS